jgi:5-methylcytosine-specific restriction endonuclease McrA
MNKAENSKCLLLNADYSPLKLICWRKAIVWSLKYHTSHNYAIKIIEYYKDKYIQGTNDKRHALPLVAKTVNYFNIYNKALKFSRNNLFIRDNYTCQYCAKIFSYNELTYDHIIPKSQWEYKKNGSPTNWTNIVTCCLACNRKKGNKTPKQANMPLINLPYKPFKNSKYLPLRTHITMINNQIPPEWLVYLKEPQVL